MQHTMHISKWGSMIRNVLSVFTAVLLFSCTKNEAELIPAEETTTSSSKNSQARPEDNNHTVPFEDMLFVPCANGGAGEDVQFSGYSNFVYQLQWGEQGFTFAYHDNVNQIKGIGLVSGENYIASGGTNGITRGTWENEKWSTTIINRLRIIGRTASFTYSYKYHITVLRDGTVTVKKTDETISCVN